MIQTIVDNSTRTMINWILDVQSSNYVSFDVVFNDGSHPFSYNYLVEFRIGYFAYYATIMTNLKSELVTISSSSQTIDFFNYTNLVSENAKNFSFFTKLLLDIEYAQKTVTSYKF